MNPITPENRPDTLAPSEVRGSIFRDGFIKRESSATSAIELSHRARQSLTAATGKNLPQIAASVAVMYSIFALVDFMTMPDTIRTQTTLIALFTTLIFATFALSRRSNPVTPERVHQVLIVAYIVLQADGLAFTVLSGDIMMSFGVAIMIIGVGCFFATIPWALATIGLLIASTWVVVGYAEIEYSKIQYGLVLLASVPFSLVVFYHRRRSALYSEEFRDRERIYVAELENAYTQINTLDGLLPICASCKNVRNDDGYWSAVELYIMERTKVTITHGICPDCAQELYPEYTHDTDTS